MVIVAKSINLVEGANGSPKGEKEVIQKRNMTLAAGDVL